MRQLATTAMLLCAVWTVQIARAHAPMCVDIPLSEVDPQWVRAAAGDLLHGEPLLAQRCAHGDIGFVRLDWGELRADGDWREYAIGVCNLERPATCHASFLVASGERGVHDIEVPYALSLVRLRELVGAIEASSPRARVTSVTYVPVADGTRWSEGQFGYEVVYVEPSAPEGSIESTRFVQHCEGSACRWLARPELFYSGLGFGESEGCRPASATMTKVNAAMRARALALARKAPPRLLDCRIRDFDRVYLARYAALERFGGWRKEADIQCAVEDLETSLVPECAFHVLAVGPNDRERFAVAFDIPLQRALELRDFLARTVASPRGSVVSIAFESVTNAGAWSAGVDGYELGVGSQTHAGGRFYRVVENCSNDRCEWRVVDEPFTRVWSD